MFQIENIEIFRKEVKTCFAIYFLQRSAFQKVRGFNNLQIIFSVSVGRCDDLYPYLF